MLSDFQFRLRALFRRKSVETELDEELRAHLEQQVEKYVRSGLPREEASRRARLDFGGLDQVKGECRDARGVSLIETVLQDVRYALRGMRKSPGFATVAILSLALGIGATTAVFSVLNAIALRPLPVAEPERLVVLQPQFQGKRFVLFNPLFEEIQRRQESLTGMFAVSDEPYLKVALDREAPTYLRGSLVSGNYFQVLGLEPALGRLLASRDDELSVNNCAAVISYSFWSSRFHRDRAALGREVDVREHKCTIIGVAPAGFRSHQSGYSIDIWVPLRPLTDPKLLASHGMAFFSGIMGRLAPGTSIAQAESELTSLYQRVEAAEPPPPPEAQFKARPKPDEFKMLVAPGAQGLDAVRRQFGQPLRLLLAVVAVVLFIAALNVANLLLTRGVARATELATRAALGAGRARIMRQLAIEGAVLAACGGPLGIALAVLGTPALATLVSLPYLPVALGTAPDYRVLTAAMAATTFAALLAGVIPAVRLSGSSLQIRMTAAGRSTGSRVGQRLVRTLVAGQLALSLLLVSSAGLLLRTMLRVMAVDPGFDTSHVVLMDVEDTERAAKFGEVDTPEQKAQRAARYQALDQRLNSLPGVRTASLSWLGLFGGSYLGLSLHPLENPQDRHFTLVDYVSPRYFETVGMQILRGRGFTQSDRAGGLPVGVVNEAFLRERIRGGEAIGRKFVMTYLNESAAFTIVGIVRDSKYNDLRESKAEPMMWVPLAQATYKIESVTLRVQPGMEAAAVREAEAALAGTSTDIMVRKVTTLKAQVDQATSRERLVLTLASGFGAVALVLAAVGLYGTLAYAVARRTQEIGVRLALGARRIAVIRLVLGDSLLLVLAGIGAGIPLSLAASLSLRTFLFGVTAHDVPAFVGACMVLAGVGFVAAFAPAYRASRVDPIAALRYE